MFDRLLEPIELGPCKIRNRIFNPPHGTSLGHRGMVTDEMIAYHQTRAKGGAGLIVIEGMTLHPSYGFEDSFIYAGDDKVIAGLKKLSKACGEMDTPVFGQLFHAGRAVRLSHDGSRPVTYSASDIPDERYRVVPVPMSEQMIWEMINSYIQAASRLGEAGLDGVEILASMGYLIAQFLNPHTNQRTDDFGGNFENRLRFLREIVSGCRKVIGASKTLGIRITLDEKTENSVDHSEMIRVCQALEQDNCLDYFSVISGSSATPGGWIHVFPPMAVPHAFVADDAAKLKRAVNKPVLVAGRINQPQVAEEIVSSGKADMVGMVRALIADPEFVNKFTAGKADTIRACVGCNQACVGHRLAHHIVSCIQNPASGREHKYRQLQPSRNRKKLVVIGGGPGGMRAATTAANSGHQVTLLEKTNSLGGQVRLAEKLPGRAEFGGVTTNLISEMQNQSIDLRMQTDITPTLLQELKPDAVIIAAGALPRLHEVEQCDIKLMDSWSAIEGKDSIGQRVAIADWSCDWTALGIAQKLAASGHHVRLYSSGSVAGESIQGIVRDQWIGELHRLGVEMIPFARFYGAIDDSAFFQHTTSDEAINCEGVDTIISCFAPRSVSGFDWIRESIISYCSDPQVFTIGDAMAPRTVEEAILEGHEIAAAL